MADKEEGINLDDFVLSNDFTDTLGLTEGASEEEGESGEGNEGEGSEGTEGDGQEGNGTEGDGDGNKGSEGTEGSEEGDEGSEGDEGEEEGSEEGASEEEGTEGNDEEGEDGEAAFLPLIELIHEHNGWEFKEDDFEDKNSIEGLMEFVGEVISQNSRPEYASEETAKFDEFIRKYGPEKAGDYLTVNHGQTDWSEANLEDADVKKDLWRNYLKETTKFSDKKIEKEISKAEDLGELDEELEDMQKYMVEAEQEKKKAFEEAVENERKAEYENYQKYLSDQRAKIDSKTEIAGFELSDKDKEGLYKFAYEPDKTGKTAYQKLRESDKDLDLKLLMLAYKGVDKKKISKQAESDAAKKVKKSLSRFKDKTGKGKSGTAAPKQVNPSSETDYNDFVFNR